MTVSFRAPFIKERVKLLRVLFRGAANEYKLAQARSQRDHKSSLRYVNLPNTRCTKKMFHAKFVPKKIIILLFFYIISGVRLEGLHFFNFRFGESSRTKRIKSDKFPRAYNCVVRR